MEGVRVVLPVHPPESLTGRTPVTLCSPCGSSTSSLCPWEVRVLTSTHTCCRLLCHPWTHTHDHTHCRCAGGCVLPAF